MKKAEKISGQLREILTCQGQFLSVKENIINSIRGKNPELNLSHENASNIGKKIISSSRRSDIPAFYSDWFIERIREGVCRYKNPFGGQIFEVNINPFTCLGIVFWTRFPIPLFKYIPELQNMGYKFYFQFTITGYPKIFETHNPPLKRVLDSFKKLSDMISPDNVFWRYDPLIFSSITDRVYHLKKFEILSKSLKGFTGRCYFSFADYYSKTRKNFLHLVEEEHLSFYIPTLEEQIKLSSELKDIASVNNIKMFACCSDNLVGNGIHKARCVDDSVFRKNDSSLPPLKPRPSRPGCGCIESTDIGTYDSCPFGCVYCYATTNRNVAVKYFKAKKILQDNI